MLEKREKRSVSICLCLVLASCFFAVSGVAGTSAADDDTGAVTTKSLLKELVDLRGLSLYPSPEFFCRQFSSYDPKSVSPEKEWFANADCGHYLRIEENNGRKEHVCVDAEGPGAIVRIWSANPKGVLRVYVDHSPDPVIEALMTDFLNGKTEGFLHPITHTSSRGWNSYFPIPYAKHCKITSDEGGFYYQVNYRTYAPGTKVVSFKPGTASELSDTVEAVAKILQEPVEASFGCLLRSFAVMGFERREKERKNASGDMKAADLDSGNVQCHFWEDQELNLARGETVTFMRLQGSKAVANLSASVAAEDVDAALRGILLTAVFDGIETIRAPLGDFFGAAPGLNPYSSLPLGVTEGGLMWSCWWMPFEKSAELSLTNLSGQEAKVSVGGVSCTAPWTERSMHFYAKWRIEKQIPTRPMIDWNYLTLNGRGVFVGDALYVSNPVKNWWGEGDEKIYVDGEEFPSHFGTGTEDYYGYAWCSPELFSGAFHNQPRCDGPNNYGHTAVNRWHILDRIPFAEKFRFDMEVWHWAEVNVDYAVTSYWYAFLGQEDNFPDPALDQQALVLDKIPPYRVHRVEGVIEGEELEVLSSVGTTEKQGAGSRYSGETQLWWKEAGVGDELVLAFESDRAGPRHVLVVFTKANDYGIHQLSVNGLKAGGPIDLYKSERWGPTEEIDLGVFDLKKGRNTLTVTILDKNDKAIPNYMFGLDYIRLEGQP